MVFFFFFQEPRKWIFIRLSKWNDNSVRKPLTIVANVREYGYGAITTAHFTMRTNLRRWHTINDYHCLL